MFKHLFRLTWNKKKQNFLLIMEIFLSFIGLFAGITAILYPINNFKLPLGFEHENIWVVNFSNAEEIKNIDSLKVYRQSIKTILRSMDGVEDVTFSSINIPLSSSRVTAATKYNGKQAWGSVYTVEDNYSKLLGVQVFEGRWFTDNDVVSKERPVIINTVLKKQLFGEENPLGRIVETEDAKRMKIVGVVASFKEESEAEQPTPALFVRMDTSNMRNNIAMIIKVKPGSDALFESKVYKTLSNSIRDANVDIKHLTEMKNDRNRGLRVPLIIFCIIAVFLMVNVALGIFGVLWYNINKRKGEIGVRRAVGATGNDITKQLVGEAFVLCTLAIVLGFFFAVQFPLLGALQLPIENYVQAIILAAIFIYALVLLCAFYPGKQAARIYPAVALHED